MSELLLPRPCSGKVGTVTGRCLLWRQIVNQGGCLSVTAGGQSHGFTYSFYIANCICRCSPYYERHVMTLRDRRRQWQKSKTKVKNTPRNSAAASPYVGAQSEHHRQDSVPVKGIVAHFVLLWYSVALIVCMCTTQNADHQMAAALFNLHSPFNGNT